MRAGGGIPSIVVLPQKTVEFAGVRGSLVGEEYAGAARCCPCMSVALRPLHAASFFAVAAILGCTTVTQPIAIYVLAPDRARVELPVTTDHAPIATGSSGDASAPLPVVSSSADASDSSTVCSMPEDSGGSDVAVVEGRLRKLGFEIVQETSTTERCPVGLRVETVAGRKGAAYAFVYLYEASSAAKAEPYEKGLESAKGAVVQRGDVVYWVLTVPENAPLEVKIALDVAS